MHTLCKHIFASAERRFNTVIPSLHDRILIRIYTDVRSVLRISGEEMFDKKIRLLEFYVVGNETVQFITMSCMCHSWYQHKWSH